jgi:hypothetical protein
LDVSAELLESLFESLALLVQFSQSFLDQLANLIRLLCHSYLSS